VRIVDQRTWVVGEPAERGSDQRPERGAKIAQERRERPMSIEEKTGRDGKPAALQLIGEAASGTIVHVTGTAPWTCSEAELSVIRRYVESGGVLVIDACGGAWPFGQSISNHLLPKAFTGAPMTVLSPTHPLLAGTAEGMDNLTKPNLRPFTEQKLGKSAGRIEMYSLGKGRVIYSSIDLTAGLLGTNTWSILGHRPAFAQSFLKNVLLWTSDGAVD